jgi:tetratricopeptide (TPR) repeat protein
LGVDLLRGHVKPKVLTPLLEDLQDAAQYDLRLRVSVALATWLTGDRDLAVKMLDDVKRVKPGGIPILRTLGRAYLDVGLPKRALEVLENVSEPEAMAIRIRAARVSGDKRLESDLIEGLIRGEGEVLHPAAYYFLFQKNILAGKTQDLSETIDTVLPSAGRWTSEIADLASRTLNSTGQRAEADRLLYQVAKQVNQPVGLGESIDVRFAQIGLNMRRGGKFLFRAQYLLGLLKEEGVRDPRLSYNLALIHIRDNNERRGLSLLREAISLDPTFKPAYKQLDQLGKLDEETAAKMKRFLP